MYNDILSDKEDRKIAEVYYNIGLALSFDKKFAEAIKNFEQAVSVLEARVKMLENKVNELEESGGKEKASHQLEEYKKEIIELKDLVLLDMMAKVLKHILIYFTVFACSKVDYYFVLIFLLDRRCSRDEKARRSIHRCCKAVC